MARLILLLFALVVAAVSAGPIGDGPTWRFKSRMGSNGVIRLPPIYWPGERKPEREPEYEFKSDVELRLPGPRFNSVYDDVRFPPIRFKSRRIGSNGPIRLPPILYPRESKPEPESKFKSGVELRLPGPRFNSVYDDVRFPPIRFKSSGMHPVVYPPPVIINTNYPDHRDAYPYGYPYYGYPQ